MAGHVIGPPTTKRGIVNQFKHFLVTYLVRYLVRYLVLLAGAK